MIGLLQRVKRASVHVEGDLVGEIEAGLLVFLGVEKNDSEDIADRLLERILAYRVFEDDSGKMNSSLVDKDLGLLIVSQFTLAADTKKGLRPSFSKAAPPDVGKTMYDYFVKQAFNSYKKVATGRFGADMQVSLVNDGPVTFWLQI